MIKRNSNSARELHRGIVGIVTLNYNNARQTLNCVMSVHQLHYENKILVVVDNGSDPSCTSELNHGLTDLGDMGVHFIRSEVNLGFGGGCNLGIKAAMNLGADYIWLLNNDAEPDPLALDALMRRLMLDRNVGAVGSVLRAMQPPHEVICWGGGVVNSVTGRAHQVTSKAKALQLNYLTAASLLIPCAVLRRIGLFDDQSFFMYWEDTDLSFRIRQAGYKLGVAADSVVFHHQGLSTEGNLGLRAEYFTESQLAFLWKYSQHPVPASVVSIGARYLKNVLFCRWDRITGTTRGIRRCWNRRRLR